MRQTGAAAAAGAGADSQGLGLGPQKKSLVAPHLLDHQDQELEHHDRKVAEYKEKELVERGFKRETMLYRIT